MWSCGQNTQPNHNSLSFRGLRFVKCSDLDRSWYLTNCGRGKMVKLYVSSSEYTMSFILQPWQLFFLVFSAWVNCYQQQTIDFYWPRRIRTGDTTASRVPWAISATRSPIKPSATSSRLTASSPPLNGSGRLLRRRFSRPIGTCWERSTLRRWKCGQKEGSSLSLLWRELAAASRHRIHQALSR